MLNHCIYKKIYSYCNKRCHYKITDDDDKKTVLKLLKTIRTNIVDLVSIENKKGNQILDHISSIQLKLLDCDEFESDCNQKEHRNQRRNIVSDLSDVKNLLNKEKCITENILWTLNSCCVRLEQMIKINGRDSCMKKDNDTYRNHDNND